MDSGNLYTIPEVAARLRVCRETVRRQIRSGGIRAVRVGRNVRIPGSELQKFLAPA